MNIRISTLLAVLLVAPVAAMANAADVPPAASGTADAPAHHGRGGAMMAALRSLDLSDSQKSKIKSIVRDFRDKNRDVTDPDTRRANTREMRSEVEAVLTPDQQAQLKDAMQRMRHDRRDAGGPGYAATPAP